MAMGILVDNYHRFAHSALGVIIYAWKYAHPSFYYIEENWTWTFLLSICTLPSWSEGKTDPEVSWFGKGDTQESEDCVRIKGGPIVRLMFLSAFRSRLKRYLIGGNTSSEKHSLDPSSSLQQNRSCRFWEFIWRLSMGYFTVRLVHGPIIDIFITLIL